MSAEIEDKQRRYDSIDYGRHKVRRTSLNSDQICQRDTDSSTGSEVTLVTVSLDLCYIIQVCQQAKQGGRLLTFDICNPRFQTTTMIHDNSHNSKRTRASTAVSTWNLACLSDQGIQKQSTRINSRIQEIESERNLLQDRYSDFKTKPRSPSLSRRLLHDVSKLGWHLDLSNYFAEI